MERPWICLSNGNGTCPQSWIESLKGCFEERLGGPVSINTPFRGGHVTCTHAAEMPWIQLEMSRKAFMSNDEKRTMVISAVARWFEISE